MGANMRISHKNSIQGYVGEWLLRMDVKARAEGKPFLGLTVPQPVQSLMRHELNLCLMLELLEERLTRFERSLNGETKDCDYGAYSEAMCFLDTVYLFSKLLLDSAAGVVRYLHKFGTGCELTKRFNVMYNKSLRGELPDNLNIVFLGVETWFPQLENRRDDIIHHYETYLIGFGRNLEGEKTTVQFSP
jgi:hypothetical protein